MNNFKRKQEMNDRSRRFYNLKRPSLYMNGYATELRIREVDEMKAPPRRYCRHGFTPYRPSEDEDVAM